MSEGWGSVGGGDPGLPASGCGSGSSCQGIWHQQRSPWWASCGFLSPWFPQYLTCQSWVNLLFGPKDQNCSPCAFLAVCSLHALGGLLGRIRLRLSRPLSLASVKWDSLEDLPAVGDSGIPTGGLCPWCPLVTCFFSPWL